MGEIADFIKVATVFSYGRVKPVWFEWKKQKFKIDKITFNWEERKGRVKILYFSVISEGELYQISFDTENFVWKLYIKQEN